MTTIVEGGADDLDDVMRVMTAAFAAEYGEAWTRSQCAGILPMPGVKLTLARDGSGETVGFSLYRTISGDSELLLLAVAPEAQGNGIGCALLGEFLHHSACNGAAQVHLEVRDGNPAVRLYEAAGFQQANRRPHYYRGQSGQYDALTFVRSSQG